MRWTVLLILFIVSVGRAFATETPLPTNEAFQLSVNRALSGSIHLHWQMPPGYYLYRQYLSATTANGQSVDMKTAPGAEKNDENFGKSEVYFISADAELGPVSSPVTVTYQGCQEHALCYPPIRRTIDPVTLRVSEQPLFTPPFARKSASSGEPVAAVEGNERRLPKSADASGALVGGFLARGGVPLLLAAFIGFGILIAFTPCMFPLYPILASTLMREGERLNARRGFVLSLSYAVALAVAFSLFGAVAAWTGESLQIALQSPLTTVALALTFTALALSMFGLFELQLPSALVTRLGRPGKRAGGSVASAAVLGFSSAFVIGPCVTAPLAGALLYVARTGDFFLGAALLFALGIGKGLPLIVLGTAGAKALPKAGAWMDSVKNLFGFVFLAFALWIAELILPGWLRLVLWALWAMAVAIFLGAFDVAKGWTSPLRMAAQATGLLSAVYAVVLTVGIASGSVDPLRPLDQFANGTTYARPTPEQPMTSVRSKADFVDQLNLARSQGQPSLIYFTAEWCVSCRTVDRDVLSKTDVVDALAFVHALEVDLSEISAEKRALMRDLDVVGPPTMIFFGTNGQEVKGGRLVGEFGAGDVREAIAAARAES